MLVVDTFAWIEYFKGSRAGRKIKGKIELGRNIVPTVVLAEISKKFTDWKRDDLDEKLAFIHARSTILPLNYDTAVRAGYLRSTIGIEGIGIVDCILLAVAKEYKAKVLTGDKHFKSLDEADYFGGLAQI